MWRCRTAKQRFRLGPGRYPGRRDQRHTDSDSDGDARPDSAQRPGEKGGGNKYITSQMEGATSANVDVNRNGVVIATTPNDGLYDDSTGTTGQASFMYKVCEAGTQTCSNTVTVNFGP